jgi:DNA-binding MarR family transcriptional regulator
MEEGEFKSIIMWEKYGFISSSSHRQRILAGLRGGAKGVSELAEEVGMELSHVSKALKELEGAGFVKCLTPDLRKGRIYALTKTGGEASLRVVFVRELLEHQIAKSLDEASIPYAKNVPLRGAIFEARPDFVIPSGSAPKVIVEAKFIRSPHLKHILKESAFTAMDLKRAMKDLKVVLVVGGTSRRDLREISMLTSSEYFDAVFFEGELGGLSEYIGKCINPS